MRKLRVLLADDHPIVREGLKSLIDAQPDMEVVAEVGDGRAALEKAQVLQPDIAVIDMCMPEMNGVLVTRQLKQVAPKIRVLALSVHEEKSYPQQFFKAGASGYAIKRTVAQELVQAIRVIASGGTYFDPMLANKLLGAMIRGSTPPTGFDDLTERESEVVQLIARGHSNKEIASKLDLSVKTIEAHKKRAMDKLGLRGRAELVRYALEQGWLRES